MELYLLKSGACLAILFVFYKLVLENENMHQFKRIYLLGMLVASFGIPLITFTNYVEVLETTPIILTSISSETQIVETTSFLDYLPTILWTLYFIGVAFFSFRFIKNLSQILIRINQNQKVKFNNFINVLLTKKVIPHTFFSYIFLNKQKYDSQEIPSEVILHEQTHAKQKHSFDVLFIELLQIVFWFNPLLYFIKHSIKLNHEFLADQAVLNQGIDSSLYQNILLAFSSEASSPLPIAIGMANSINYSFIKKRFTVMKTHTSKSRIWMRSLLLLPLLAILIYSFSTKETLNKSVLENGNSFVNDFYLKIDSEENIYYNDELISFDEIPNAIKSYKETYPSEDLYYAKIDVENKETSEKLFSFAEIIKENGIKNITVCWVKIKHEDIIITINKDKSFTINNIPSTIKTLPSVLNKFNRSLTKEERKKSVKVTFVSDGSIKMGFITDIQEILIDYGINKIRIPGSILDQIKNQEVKKEYEKWYKDATSNITSKKGATKSQLAEYNKLAKKYNNQDKENRIVLMKDLERLEYIYNLMTDKQKANAEPFPDCFPPPPPFVSLKPLDHIIKMAKSNAAFFYENKRISSDKAISLIKENSELNIETTTFKNSNPIVKITKNGINNSNTNIPPPPPAPPKPTKTKKVIKGENDADANIPPSPAPNKAPKSVKDPIKTIEKLSENGAHFLFFDGGPHYKNGIEITKDLAIEALKAFKDVTVNIINDDYFYKTVEIRLKGC